MPIHSAKVTGSSTSTTTISKLSGTFHRGHEAVYQGTAQRHARWAVNGTRYELQLVEARSAEDESLRSKRKGRLKMEFPRLEITRQDAKIEVRSYPARMEISTRRSQFRMKRSHAQFRLERQLPTMRIDRSQFYTALGIGPVLQSARQYFADSLQQNLDNIAGIASAGDALMRIENGGNPIADLGVQAMEGNQRELNISALPQAEINWEPGYFNINWTPASLALEWDTSAWADIRVEPHYVEIRMKQYPEVKIRVYYDTKNRSAGGKHVDKYL